MDGNVPGNVTQIFGTPGGGGGGPCLIEPQDGTLFPNNWLRPRFRFTAPSGAGVYEIRLHAGNQANDLVVYTTATTWTMPKEMWQPLAAHTYDQPIQVTVRSAPAGGGSVQTSAMTGFQIAPVPASGTMVFWSTSGATYFNGKPTGNETKLSGFSVGDEGVAEVLRPFDVMLQTIDQGYAPRAVSCIGCHTSTPDGEFISFNDFYPWNAVLSSGKPGSKGLAPPYLGAGGRRAAGMPFVGITTFSRAHWSSGDRTMVASYDTCGGQYCAQGQGMDMNMQSGLIWVDLENAATGMQPQELMTAGAWNWIYRPNPGSGQYAAAPSWSRDGSKILFTMSTHVKSGRLGSGTAHLYTVPYSKMGPQVPTPVPGDGSAAGRAQYYGTLSADDKLIVYNEVDEQTALTNHPKQDSLDQNPFLEGMYSQPKTELYVIPTQGGTKTRLVANDPPQCPGQQASPGINNAWAKWSPEVAPAGNRVYYWLIFSSWREGARYPTGGPVAQLYMTAVAVDETSIRTYPAVYLWNQPAASSNHTPAWDIFQIPGVE
jgi:hypothetical protein